MRRVVLAYRRLGVWAEVAGFTSAAYLAVANVLRGAEVPSEEVWQAPRVTFWMILATAVVTPAFALVKTLDAREEKSDKRLAARGKEQAVLDADMSRFCQEIAFQLSRLCPNLRLDETAVQIWLCDERTEVFDRRWRFFLPYDRKPSGIQWRKGLGVAGAAWIQNRDLAVDLVALKKLSKLEFEKLTDDERYGMSYDLIQSSGYSGIIATRIFALTTGGRLLGMLVIDYVGSGSFACIEQAIGDSAISKIIGSCGRRLAEATFLREDST